MESIKFNELVDELDSHAKVTMNKKGPEYTMQDKDVLNNFKSTAKKDSTAPLGRPMAEIVSSAMRKYTKGTQPQGHTKPEKHRRGRKERNEER